MENKKENVFKKVLTMFLNFLKNLVVDFITSFKYNNMKLPAILVAVPGLAIGFFLTSFAPTLRAMEFKYAYIDYNAFAQVEKSFPGMPFNYSGLVVFLVMLFGILNVFVALSMNGKKNLGSVVTATILTALMVILTALFIYAVMYFLKLNKTGEYVTINGVKELKKVVIDEAVMKKFNNNYIISISAMVVCDILSIVGLVLGYINYDRTYEKVDR